VNEDLPHSATRNLAGLTLVPELSIVFGFSARGKKYAWAQSSAVGWHQWEALNPTTGYPHSFTELPTAVSIDI